MADEAAAPPPAEAEASAPPTTGAAPAPAPGAGPRDDVPTPPANKPLLTPEELIAQGRAPVKAEFLAPHVPKKVKAEAVDGGGAAKKKSNNQVKREKREERESDTNLCWPYIRGKCNFGDACRRSHNVSAFLDAKEPDLPGRCPFESTGQCNFGIMCRWLSSHKNHDDFTKTHLAEVEAAVKKSKEADPPDTTATGEDRSKDVSVPSSTVELPVSDNIQPEINGLPYELQVKLRKKTFMFPRSTSILKEFGYHMSKRKGQKGNQAKKQRGSGDADVSSAGEAKIYDVKREQQDGTTFDADLPLRPAEKKTIDFRGKLYLAPLTTVGNLPYRRLCKGLGVDITCSEMAMATNLLQGHKSEWALMKRHPCEDIFGIQICGGYPDAVATVSELLEDNVSMDFLDVNCGCPIDLICNKGAGSSLLTRLDRLESVVKAGSRVVSCPFTFKTRKAYHDGNDLAHTFLPKAAEWGAAAVTLHGRTRAQRYSKQADWAYVEQCARKVAPTGLQLIGNGDIYSYSDYKQHMEASRTEDGEGGLATCMIARGALIKPWIFTEIKEQRNWDISASERLDLLKQFCSFGLEHWGSDSKGVETTRRFLLEWLSFLHRYIPVGLLERLPCQLHWRPPAFVGRSDLETLLASGSASDWVKISEMLLGPAPASFSFAPKHKSNAYANAGPSSEAAMALDEGVENG